MQTYLHANINTLLLININADSFIVQSVFESLSPGHLPSMLCQIHAINNATIVTSMNRLE